MSASFEDTVFDFDLNFLNQPTTSNTEQDTQTRLEKLRRSIIYLKKKVVFADAAVCRYKTARHYARVLENNQLYSNEGCKQHLIEIRNFIDKVGKLETENRQLEERIKEKNKEIGDLQNKYEALEKTGNQIQLLLKEKSKQPDPPKAISNVDKDKKKDNCKSCNKNQLKYDILDKEVETLRKDNNRLSWLERDNEKLRKENARIPSLAQEILDLRKEVSDLATPDAINDGIKKATAKIQYLQKEIDELLKENSKIVKLEKEIEVLRAENAKAKNFEKEIAKLHRETAKIPKLKLENDILRKECTKIPNLEKEVSVLSVKNAKLANLERLHKNLCDELVKVPYKGKELENLLSRFNLAVTPTGTPQKQGKHNSVHNDTSEVDDIEGAEDTVVPSTPVRTAADKQAGLVKSAPEPRLSTDDDITEVVDVDTGHRTSLNNSNIETPSKSIVQMKDSVITSTVPVIVYNESQGLHRNKNTNENLHTQSVSIVSKCVPKDMTSPNHSEDHTPSKSEVKENVLRATVPTIVYNQNLDVSCKKVEVQGHNDQIERIHNYNLSKDKTQVPTIMFNDNNICFDENVVESQEYDTQKVSTAPKCVPNNNTPIATMSDQIATSKVQCQKSVITAVPTIVYNQNVDHSSNDNPVEPQGHDGHGTHRSTQIARERESLELNNSKVRESRIELELEKIFSNMKMSFNAVTPIPKTPTRVTEERIITNPTEKLLKCMMLSDKSDKLLLKLKEHMHCHTKELFCQSNPRFALQTHIFESESRTAKYKIDKLIQCFEAILRSKQILSEDSMDMQPNLQISEQPLYNKENNLDSITNKRLPERDVDSFPEDMENIHAVTDLGDDPDLCDNTSLFDDTEVMQEDTHISQNHQEDLSVSLSENVIESSATQLPEKDIIILHNLQDENRPSQISKPVTVDKKQERSTVKNKMFKASDSVRRSNITTQKKKRITRGVKNVTSKKHTQLDKLKKRLQPKYKIRRESPLLQKSNIKPKPMPPTKKTVSANDTSVSLNNKDVYEKAVKVMAEINSQKSKMLKSPPVRRKSMLSPTHKMSIEDEIDVIPNSPPRMTRAMSLKLSGLDIDTDISYDKVPMTSPKNTQPLLSPKLRNSLNKEAGQNVNEITSPTTCKGTLLLAVDRSGDNVPNSTPKHTECPLSSKLNDSVQTEIDDSEEIVPTSPVEDPKTPFTFNIETSGGDKVPCSPPKELKTFTVLESTMEIEVNSSCGGIISNLPPKELQTPKSTVQVKMNNDDKMPNEKRVNINVDIVSDSPVEVPTTSRRKSATQIDNNNCDKGQNPPTTTLLTTRRKSALQTEITVSGNKEQNLVSGEADTPGPARRKSVVQFELNTNGDKVTNSLNKDPKTSLSTRRKSCLEIEINKESDKVQSSPPQEPKTPLSPRLRSSVRTDIHNEANKVLYSPPKVTKTPLSPRLRSFTQNECYSSNSPPKQTKALLSPRSRNIIQDDLDQIPQKILITPRTKRKISELFDNCAVVLTKDETLLDSVANKNLVLEKAQEETESQTVRAARRKRRSSSDEPLVQPKRILRSSGQKGESDRKSGENTNSIESTSKLQQSPKPTTQKIVTYDDLDMWSDDDHQELAKLQELVPNKESVTTNDVNTEICHPKESILCCMIEKYGVDSVKPFAKKPSDYAIKQLCEKIEKEITTISELPMNETKNAMNKLVADLRKTNHKLFITAMMKYLTKPERKQELFGKISLTAAPAMTKAEQILLYVVAQLKNHWPIDIVDAILSNIEYTLFRLNRTPEFDVIESMSHFYALLCRYIGAKSRLRLFILDAMYCIQYKSVPLIKQCIEIWMHIIPLAHMGIAKNPLVTCLVYLLHFYKCDDKLNRVQDIRNILSRKYFYQITDWNETKILEMFKNCIKDLKDIPIDKKTLRLALIILAKRHGPRWCQNNIIKNLLQPMIEKEGVSDNVKEFCVSMIGPLMKPYPVDMKIYCEIAMNQLTDILKNNPSPKMEEAAITSMLFINRHNQDSINKILLTRKMKPLSPDLEKTLCDYVKTKPLKVWKKHLSVIARVT
ncbi:uncharacterized protein LOC118273692 [Spodoptera frugiperda]|uniref:Uncharacterized protein LOC118273692 n=1 Tax=Spodoptera frugiperda TaxID=7108 RepID=A0A9R0DB62_SPOFR|nr:uncharacterized protein LOC118273692 [Spodoptera frugiperda]